jgi:hypothetical protein
MPALLDYTQHAQAMEMETYDKNDGEVLEDPVLSVPIIHFIWKDGDGRVDGNSKELLELSTPQTDIRDRVTHQRL